MTNQSVKEPITASEAGWRSVEASRRKHEVIGRLFKEFQDITPGLKPVHVLEAVTHMVETCPEARQFVQDYLNRER